MTDEQKAAYVNANAACALIEAMGMVAENQLRTSKGQSQAYGEESFFHLLEYYGIHSNTTLTLFHGF